jgi:5-methylcytosine-specific restriction protein B
LLILAHGVSETHIPNQTWNLQGVKTITELFEEKNLNPPYRYGASYVFQSYDVNSLPEKEKIENDLNKIIEKYSKLISSSITPSEPLWDDFDSKDIIADITSAGLIFDYILINRCISSLITKPFLILTGLSGSGKTKLAQAFVKWICELKNQYKVVPVGADWTNREPLLGYPNALDKNEYVKPDNGVLDLLINATENPDLPYFLILDEMNLSHVERYFADFLSAMESNEEIPLHKESKSISGVPSSIRLPKNLFVIGTVNIDETTHMFSPKVLDRANTLEFRIDPAEMNHFLDNIGEVNMDALVSKGSGMAKRFVQLSLDKSPLKEDLDKINPELAEFFVELKKAGAEFGYRSATEILRLIKNLSIIDPTLTLNQKLDIGIIQKLLPKLHGSRNKLNKVLVKLAPLCFEKGNFKIESDILNKEDFDFNSD